MGRITIGANQLKRLHFLLPLLFMISTSAAIAQEAGNCGDGVDNDNDGLIDCYDPDCSGSIDCDGFYYGSSTPGCQSTPTPGEPFTLTRIWDTDANLYPMDQRQSVLVADMDGDGIPEVIGKDDSGKIYIFNGEDGTIQTTINSERMDTFLNAPAIADVDRDGTAEIFITSRDRELVRYEHDGTRTWINTTDLVSYNATYGNQWTPEIADFNADGTPEIYVGNQIFDTALGTKIAEGGSTNSVGAFSIGDPKHDNEPFSVAVDILPDASCANCSGLELVAGNQVYSVNIATGTMTVEVTASPATLGDGVTSIADFDLDGDLDAIVNVGGDIYIWDVQTSAQLGFTISIPSTNYGGHPNVADFDSDNRPEIGVSGRSIYMVIDDFASGMGTLWSVTANDNSAYR